MIRVGITDNVVLSKAEKNDKGTLVVGIKELGTEVKEKKASILDDLSDGSDTSGNDGMGEVAFLMFMPSLTKFDKDEQGNEVALEGPDVLKGFVDFKNQLVHFLKRFTTSANIKFSPFAGIAINAADEKDIFAKIVQPAIAEKVYSNYVEQFIRQITPFLNLDGKPSRLFLHRKSEASHFGVLRKKFLDNQPFFEPMELPITQSKMWTKQTDKTTKFYDAIEVEGIKYVPNFTPYELGKKLDNPAKIEGAPDAASAAADQEIENVENLFKADAPGAEDGPAVFQIEE